MIWLVILAVGLGSYAMRAVPLFTIGRLAPSERTARAIERAGAAALVALATTSVAGTAAGGSLASVLAIVAGGIMAIRGATLSRVVATGVVVHLLVDVLA